MSRNSFRAWGLLPWVLDRVEVATWSLIGSISTEKRCLGTWKTIRSRNQLAAIKFLQIKDPPSRFSAEISHRLSQCRDELEQIAFPLASVEEHALFARTDQIRTSIQGAIDDSSGNLVLDISSLPKRYFFMILRILWESDKVNNLLATYTRPRCYAGGTLAENPQSWRHLPLFDRPYPEPAVKAFVIGVGFEALGLPELLEQDYQDATITMLFPFPPGPPMFHRSWDFVQNIEKSLPRVSPVPIRVDALDVSSTFDHLCALSDGGNSYTEMAPYGPKPMSLAMCIYAILSKSAVYYTQPTAYNPDYSVGISLVDGLPETYAYCLRLGGRNLYSLNSH